MSSFYLVALHNCLFKLALIDLSAVQNEPTDIVDGCKVVLSCRRSLYNDIRSLSGTGARLHIPNPVARREFGCLYVAHQHIQ